ncbi:MAG: histidine kinase [Bacteroidetes bacterium]|nr:histidine kinase [Bacteroidota bacterium]MBS1632857.1 histidine kinase [Bacteroidota bacterium]
MKDYAENSFIFSPRYRLLRHMVFWLADTVVFTFVFRADFGLGSQLLLSLIWTALHMAYAYPVMYVFIPRFLLKEKLGQFILIMISWAVLGWFWNHICRKYIYSYFIALIVGQSMTVDNTWSAGSFLSIVVIAGIGSTIVLFKYWIKKQRDFLNAEKEKINAELQLLKAQVHPHFLFNTLNNIYSFSLRHSDKTPQMILKLSSLLSYMLYDCKSNEVLLEKEVEIMKNYIDLEKERYGGRLDVSINIEGDIGNKYIAPLLLLPFLENAFKHGTSEQLEKPWLSMEIFCKQDIFRCKIVNSKNEDELPSNKGIGIDNVRRRLNHIYPGKHELKISDEGNFFIVSLLIELNREPVLEKFRKASLMKTD